MLGVLSVATTTPNKLSGGLIETMPHAFIVDKKKWEEAQKRYEEFRASEEGQKLRQQMLACASSFEELMTTGKTTVKVVVNEEIKQ